MEAFASRQPLEESVPAVRRNQWWPWLTAAAATIAIVGFTVLWRAGAVTPANVTQQAAVVPPAVPPPASTSLDHGQAPPVTKGMNPVRKSSRRPQRPTVVRPAGFVELPGAAALPAFESGEIVRMDVPLSSLPGYGFDISSGAGNGPVAADVLIGQDGRARAIRLVTNSTRSTQ